MNQKTALAIIIALFVVFVLAYLTFGSATTVPVNNVATTTPSDIPQTVSIQGTYVCLPIKETDTPNTMECALGVRTDNGVHYAIDAQGEPARNMLLGLQTGIRIQLDGTLVPINQLSTDIWQKFEIDGIVSTQDIKRI